MGSVRPELSLDFRPTFVPKTITDFLKEISMIGNVSEKLSKLNGFVKLLEEEMRKIDAFKRELPYCMLLLNDAILVLKEEAIQCAARNAQPVLEEFIPLKKNDNNGDEEGSSVNTKNEKESNSNNKDKKNWMSSVQLWNSDDGFCSDNQKPETKQKNDEDPFQGCKDRGGVGEFTPFKAYSVFAPRKEEKELLSVPGLTLLTPGIKNLKEESGSSPLRASSSKAVSSSDPNAQSNVRSGPQPPQHQTARKQRRCWSPELHRRFVNALQQLGGSQVATPKQIRELMQVDGLTNDEVKSHLQKYRLHTRRLPSATTTPAVLGSSLWLSQQQYGESSKGNASHSGSPDGPLQLTANTGGDSMEDEEDAKSESYSWRSHVHKPRKIAV